MQFFRKIQALFPFKRPMERAQATCVWAARAHLGEGPVWRAEEEALYWIDIATGAVHRYETRTRTHRTWRLEGKVGCLVPCKNGSFVIGVNNTLIRMDLDSGRNETLFADDTQPAEWRFNDGACDSKGRLWIGTMDVKGHRHLAGLYRLDANGSLTCMDDGYVICNGPAISNKSKLLYQADTIARRIYAFDLEEDGSLRNKRLFVQLEERDGYPDGMTLDEEDHLWVAHFGGWRVTRFTPDGRVDRVILLPVGNVTSCTFGGPELRTLYITTACQGLNDKSLKRQPLAGGLFAAEIGVRGVSANFFGN